MASSKQLKISVDMAVSQPQYLVVDTGITSVLFDSTDDATEYAYSISGKKMTDQRDTEVDKVKQTDTEHSCDIPLKDRTALNREYNLTNYRGYILYVKFFKPNEYAPCARQILIVKPADLLISRVAFIDSKNNDLGPCSVQYQADLRFGMRMEFSRSLLRNEKVPTLICKVFYSDAITKEYKEVPDMGIDGKFSGNYIIYCNDGLPESLAGADFVFSFGFNEPYSSPFIDQKTNKLTPTIQKIHLLSREVKKPEINTVVWSSKEKITFGEKSSKRATICRNEDGFLHIHTYGMYGEHVRVEIFEKDSTFTKYLLLGTLEDVVIIDNTAYVPVEMSGVYSKADKMRSLEGDAFEIVARITPLDTSISPGESEIIQLKIEKKPSEANPARCTINGTQKFIIAEGDDKEKEKEQNKDCGGKFCITKANYKQKNAGKLIQEINIRLAGFGGNIPTEEFDDRTEATIKQFQRDYMGVTETGKICGSLLKSIDEFCDDKNYNFNFYQTKCPCGKCKGYGNSKTSGKVQLYKNNKLQPTATYNGIEYPGMHRSVLFGVRGFLFYLNKNIKLGYSLTKISSGYRCWESNAIKHRKSTNHMGKAIDMNFNKSTLTDIEAIRDKVLIPNLKAQIRWSTKNKFSLEPSQRLPSKPTEFIATSWIHMDVREYETKYLDNKFFVKSESDMKGQKLTDIAKELGLTDMCNCIVASKK